MSFIGLPCPRHTTNAMAAIHVNPPPPTTLMSYETHDVMNYVIGEHLAAHVVSTLVYNATKIVDTCVKYINLQRIWFLVVWSLIKSFK